ncbi:tripartite tricarboxylate transporter TctB family protein [Salsuginibacillus halophilus]|uniref:Tripartite tricarboxylate transporter TctB family protein n=1 Tax=Salsuginibacillus halophilus TaxID=517424 RepID=A0A2P8HQP4_9BACI|nr:tripartite tricarboxylate transporter TctB family protein [Salsuginibacillus halophilus]PSL48535.1 tripartite tricarboxylate transporter TctB family protein [Salsuginibacillus halophilus]
MSNYILGVAILLFAGAAYTQTTDFDTDAALLPNLVLGSMAVIGVLMVIDPLVRKALNKPKMEEKDGEEKQPLTWRIFFLQILIPALILLGTYLLLELFGFYISSLILIIVVFFYHNYLINRRRPDRNTVIKGMIFAVVAVVFMYILFSILIGLPTPDGSIIDLD